MPTASMSSRLENTSAILGEYMLKGWTLTDLHCEDCHTTPLMREPAGAASAAGRDRIQFCASCDGSPAGRQSSSAASTSTPIAPAPAQTQAAPYTRSIPQPDPSESISTLLLQGYSLLGDNCPNTTCRGIPLVGYPRKKDGSKDGRRMCVSCGGRWVDGNDLGGMTLLSGAGAGTTAGAGGSGAGPSGSLLGGGESPRSKARREMYGLPGPGPSDNDIGKSAAAPAPAQPSSAKVVPDLHDDEDDFGLDREEDDEPELQQRIASTTPQATTSSADPMLASALTKTSTSLAKTLDRIATSLDRHTESSREEGRYFVDVKLHTEAIKDVMAAMEVVRKYSP